MAVVGLLCLFVSASIASVQQADAAPRLIWRIEEEARGIPAYDGHSAYVLSQRHELLAVRGESGRVRWRVPMDSTGVTFGSRVIVRGDVVVAGDYDLMGVDRRTGRRRWIFSPADGGGAGMHLGEGSGGLVFSGSLAGALHAVATETGRPRWSVSVGDPARTTVYAPVVAGSAVAATFTEFGTAPAGGVVVVDIRTGAVRWRRTVPGSIGASGNPVFAGGAVLAASRNGTIHAFAAASGKPLWTWPKIERLRDDQDYRPIVAAGRVVVAGSLSGEIVAHDLLTRKVLWRRSPVMASVAFGMTADAGVLFVPYLSNQIVALRIADGTELWRLGGGLAQLRWVPFVDGSVLLASGSRSFSLFRHTARHLRGRS